MIFFFYIKRELLVSRDVEVYNNISPYLSTNLTFVAVHIFWAHSLHIKKNIKSRFLSKYKIIIDIDSKYLKPLIQYINPSFSLSQHFGWCVLQLHLCYNLQIYIAFECGEWEKSMTIGAYAFALYKYLNEKTFIRRQRDLLAWKVKLVSWI